MRNWIVRLVIALSRSKNKKKVCLFQQDASLVTRRGVVCCMGAHLIPEQHEHVGLVQEHTAEFVMFDARKYALLV